MNAAAIRTWCLKQPRPASLRLTSGRDVRTVAIAAGVPWSQIARTAEAMSPDLIEALDTGGNLIRAIRPDDDNGDDDDAKPATPTPATAAALIVDPETARFNLFATLLSDAYKHANEVAFGKLVEIANIMGKRGESLEKSLASTERLLRASWQENADLKVQAETAGNGDLLTDLAGAVMQGMGQANGAPAKTNGKA